MNRQSSPQLDLLARHLLRRREAILANWSNRVEERDDSELILLTRAEFNDHIPAVLNALHAELRQPDDDADEAVHRAGTEHGAHRWQQGFDLLQVIRDWGDLHRELLREFEQFPAECDEMTAASMIVARDILAGVIHDGIAQSVKEYQRLQRIEAEGRASDIDRVLGGRSPAAAIVYDESLGEASRRMRGSLEIIRSAVAALTQGSLETAQLVLLDRIRSASGELTGMLSALRDLARLEAKLDERMIEPFDAAELLRETAASFETERDLRVEYAGPVSLAVRGDRPKIERIVRTIVLELLAGCSTGRISLLARAEPPRRWSLVIEVHGTDASLAAAGVLAGEIEKITSESQVSGAAPPAIDASMEADASGVRSPIAQGHWDRADVARESPGVCLAIVHRLCELLDATLEINTRAEPGSTFRVVLPRDYKE